MQSLYEISDELLSIFNEIENNDGEVNEEQLQALEIAQENLQEKLASYKRAIRCWESDINACKEEEKRIKTARQVKENRIDKLKDRMLGAILQFGYEGKPNKKGKTNHFYELPDGRIPGFSRKNLGEQHFRQVSQRAGQRRLGEQAV